jgi:transposase
MPQVSVRGIDIAKQLFHVVGMDDTGTVVWRKRLTRRALMPFIAQMPPVVIGMEACGGAHYWARWLPRAWADREVDGPPVC